MIEPYSDANPELSNDFVEELDGDEIYNYNYHQETDIYPDVTIKVEREQYSLFELKRKYDKKPQQVVLDPDYQRDDVWVLKQRSELIESVLMGIPLPMFYLNETKDGRLVVVDGRQRLTTIFRFFDNQFKLQQLRILKNLEGQTFSKLEGSLQSKLEDYQIIAQVIKPPTPDRVIFDIFDRVNRGGTQLNQQEMRNALYQGKATELINKLAKNNFFLKATDTSITTSRMKDRYMILRLLSFLLWKKGILKTSNGLQLEYKPKELDEFLGKTMERINVMSNEDINILEKLFSKTMENNYIIFGNRAFRRDRRYPINLILFESFGYLFIHLDTQTCLDNRAGLQNLTGRLLSDNVFRELLSSDRGRGIVIPSILNKMDDLLRGFKNDLQFEN
ncbi:DUF262 domain-containing protein [Paenibacillus sp. MMS18-CY102]|uniref:DUF262 domain-containing protein n=1 Tax=Paenibacillus sp. MMS18-CY102 TaxID=2682849 RepID=UPI001F1C4DA2|nr:DUF262 domain-containing protein [Paenibacillus sp. MMS18-CY102]